MLDRPEHERNPIERKASSAIRNLGHAVIFMLDPSETSGMDLLDQETLVGHLRDELDNVPSITLENKCDLEQRETSNLKVSCITGDGVEAVNEWLTALVKEIEDASFDQEI